MKNVVITGGYGTKQFNLHSHETYEIVLYVSGSGVLYLNGKEMPVKKGNIFIVPPKVTHGSISHDNLRYISLSGNQDQLLHIDTPIFFTDNDKEYARYLSQMILENKHGNEEFFNTLCRAYILFLLDSIKVNTEIEKAVYKIKSEIVSNFCDVNFNVTNILNNSGYSEDYIRTCFKNILGKTPVELVNELRIDNAKSLISVYRNSMSLFDIALNCGFDDYIYFSRKFKEQTGLSPYEYKKSLHIN